MCRGWLARVSTFETRQQTSSSSNYVMVPHGLVARPLGWMDTSSPKLEPTLWGGANPFRWMSLCSSLPLLCNARGCSMVWFGPNCYGRPIRSLYAMSQKMPICKSDAEAPCTVGKAGRLRRPGRAAIQVGTQRVPMTGRMKTGRQTSAAAEPPPDGISYTRIRRTYSDLRVCASQWRTSLAPSLTNVHHQLGMCCRYGTGSAGNTGGAGGYTLPERDHRGRRRQ